MKKKAIIGISIVVVIVVAIILLSLNKVNTSSESNTVMKLGNTVETDIVRLTLINSKLCIALNNTTSSNDMFKPKEYDSVNDVKNPYVASKGHTYVAYTIKIENLDRNSIDLGGSFNNRLIQIQYNGNTYKNQEKTKARSTDNITWEKYDSSNILLLAGETYYYRGYVDIETDANLDDDFDIIFALPNSQNKIESFDYNITKNDIENYVEPEISLHDALSNFSNKIGYNYIKDHCLEFEKVNGTELNEILNGKQFNVVEKETGTWTGTFKFEEDGRIQEGGNKYTSSYTNKRTWKIDNDTLICTATPSSNTKTYAGEVRKVIDSENNTTYYLGFNGETPYLLMY